MPRAPKYQSDQVGTERPVEARFRAADNNGGAFGAMGAGLEQFGQVASNYANVQDQINAQNDDTQARALATDAGMRLTTLADEYQSLKAGTAREAQAEYRKRLDEARNEALEQASNPRMRRMLEERLAAQYQRSVQAIGTHAVREQRVEREIVLISQEASEVTLAANESDPEVADAYLARAVGIRFDKIEELNGFDRDNPEHKPIFETARMEVASAVHGQRLDLRFADPDFGVDEALAYVEAYDDEMSPELKAATLGRLKTPLQERSSRSIVDTVMGLATEAAEADPTGEADDTVIAMPVAGSVPRGGRFADARDGGKRQHRALDISAPIGTPIYTVAPGRVTAVKPLDGASGNWVQVTHPDGATSTYSHMNSFAVKVGDTVGAGAVLGEVGNTGAGTGPHLHLVMRDASGNRVDPEKQLGQSRSYTPQAQEHDRASLYKRLDAYARENDLDPEETERARQELDRRIERDEGLLSEVRREAEESAALVVEENPDTFRTNMIPRNVWQSLSPLQRAQFESIERETHKPGKASPNGETALRTARMINAAKNGDPQALRTIAGMNPAVIRPYVSEAEYEQFVLEIDDLRMKPPRPGDDRSKIDSTLTEAKKWGGPDLSNEPIEQLRVRRYMEIQAAEWRQRNGGKEPDTADYDRWLREATRENTVTTTYFGIIPTKEKRRASSFLSPNFRVVIEREFRQKFGREPTKDEIEAWWERMGEAGF